MKSLVISIGICLLLTARAVSQDMCGPIPGPLTFEKLTKTLEDCNLLKIEQLLPLLPRDFRSRYVLVYSSRSLQGASPKFPRVIMFGLDARFMIAFSGDRDLPGYDLLETIEFNDQAKAFEFHSITFPAEKRDLQIQNLKPVFSEKNPGLCISCHRKDFRPNWDTYAAWPGVYGSNNDSLPGAEREQYRTFQDEVFMRIGRYRFFEDAAEFPDWAWYYDYYTASRPNLQFNWLLSLLNSQSISMSIKENPKLHPYRYALLAALSCHDEMKDPVPPAEYIPSTVLSQSGISYQKLSQEVLESVKSSYLIREKRQCQLLHSLNPEFPVADWECKFYPKEIDPAINTVRFRYIMEVAGVPFPKEWSMEFGSEHFVFYAGEVGEIGELGLYLWRNLLDPVQDDEIYKIYQQAWDHRKSGGYMVFPSGKEEVCRFLKEKSLTVLSSN